MIILNDVTDSCLFRRWQFAFEFLASKFNCAHVWNRGVHPYIHIWIHEYTCAHIYKEYIFYRPEGYLPKPLSPTWTSYLDPCSTVQVGSWHLYSTTLTKPPYLLQKTDLPRSGTTDHGSETGVHRHLNSQEKKLKKRWPCAWTESLNRPAIHETPCLAWTALSNTDKYTH